MNYLTKKKKKKKIYNIFNNFYNKNNYLISIFYIIIKMNFKNLK